MGGSEILEVASPYRERIPVDDGVPSNRLQTDQLEQLPLVAEFWAGVRSGDLQLWEPEVGTGIPMFTGVHNRVLAPTNVAFLFVPAALGSTVSILLGLLIAQIGAFGLARRLGLSRGAGLIVAVGYAFSGPVTALLLRIHEVFLLPGLLWALHAAFENDDRRVPLAAVSLLTAGVWFSGFPAAGLFVLYTTGAYLLYLTGRRLRVAGPKGGWRPVIGSAVPAGAALGAGTLIASVQLLPTLEFLQRSGALERQYHYWDALGVMKLATAAAGRFFGAYQDQDWWWPEPGRSNPVEASSTAGLIAIALIAVLLLRRGRPAGLDRALAFFFVPLGVIDLVAVYLGGPVLWAIQQLPYMDANLFGRSRFLLALVVALMAGVGWDSLRGQATVTVHDLGARLLGGFAGIYVGLVALAVYLAGTEGARLQRKSAIALDLAIVGAVLLAAVAVWWLTRHRVAWLAAVPIALLLAVELQVGAWGFVAGSDGDMFYPQDAAFEPIANDVSPGGSYRFFVRDLSLAPPHTAAYNDLRDLRVSYPSVDRFRELLEAADPGVFQRRRLRTVFTDELDLTSPMLDRTSTKYLLSPLKLPLVGLGEPVGSDATGVDLPVAATLPETEQPLRAVGATFVPGDCKDGWVDLRAADGELLSRRLLREIGDAPVTFPLADRRLRGQEVELTATHCDLELTDPRLVAYPAAGPLEVISVDGMVIYERPAALPRAGLAPTLRIEPDPQARLAALAAVPAAEAVFVNHDPGVSGSTGIARIVAEDSDHVRLDVASEEPGLLVLRDAAAPGWKVEVDGQPADMVVVDHAFRGVAVPAGGSKVEFRYLPDTLVLGVAAAGAGVLLTLGLVWWTRRRMTT